MQSELNPPNQRPLIFDIARGSYSDGPGMRTVVFLKGCPLRCQWCQNPESQLPGPQEFFDPQKCIQCGQCRNGCNFSARQPIGKYDTPINLARLIYNDHLFYRVSNGGVTFSGGEPLSYIPYLAETSSHLDTYDEKIHITVETSGFFNFNLLKKRLLHRIDLYLFDIKIMNPEKHKHFTGQSNSLILENFKRLVESDANIQPRTPLIPGITDTPENVKQIRDFLSQFNLPECLFLPYNPSGLKKWAMLGKTLPEALLGKFQTINEE